MRRSNDLTNSLCLLVAALVLMPLMMSEPAKAKGCVHVMKSTGKSALRQGKAEKNAIRAFLNVAYSRFGENAHRTWAQVPGAKLICRGGARKTCVASGVPCRAPKGRAIKPTCPQKSSDFSRHYNPSYRVVVDGGDQLGKRRSLDICAVQFRKLKATAIPLPPSKRRLACSSGFKHIVRPGKDTCQK